MRRSVLHVQQILEWADDHYARTGRWPKQKSGRVLMDRTEKWLNLDKALRSGLRGFPGGWSLSQLLHEYRGVRHHLRLPRLTVKKILAWADAHRRKTGKWPTVHSGWVANAPDETWLAVNTALDVGLRGLPGGSSLARLLSDHRDVRNPKRPPKLSVAQILRWADAHRRRTRRWPGTRSGPVAEQPHDTWYAIERALNRGSRGLPGGSSLRKLIAKHRGASRALNKPPLTTAMIVGWAKSHYRRFGEWPSSRSGPVLDAPGETWCGVANALYLGYRGLPRGGALWRLCQQAAKRRWHPNAPPTRARGRRVPERH